MIDWGDPKVGDGTAKREQFIIRAAQRRQKRIEDAVKLINRPIGSKANVPPEEEKADWQMRVTDVEALKAELDQRSQVVGPLKAELEMRTWDQDMRKKYGEPPPLPPPPMPEQPMMPPMGAMPPMPVMGAEGMM